MGAQLDAREGRFTPLTISGRRLEGIDYELPVASAQIKSCVLFAGLLASGATSVTEPAPTRDHTERMLRQAGARVERDGATVTVHPQDELEVDDIHVPGDPSSIAFHAAAAMLVPGSRLVLEDVGVNWTRVGFLRIAQRMGAVVVGPLEEPPGRHPGDAEPIAELDVRDSALGATVVEAEEVPLAIDELPLVALLGCFAEGETIVRGAAELRLKETDRIATVVDGLRGLGADIEAAEDGFVVRGTGGLRGGTMEAHGDHRLAMLGAVAGLASREGVEVVGMEAAAVSYPGFTADLERLLSRRPDQLGRQRQRRELRARLLAEADAEAAGVPRQRGRDRLAHEAAAQRPAAVERRRHRLAVVAAEPASATGLRRAARPAVAAERRDARVLRPPAIESRLLRETFQPGSTQHSA